MYLENGNAIAKTEGPGMCKRDIEQEIKYANKRLDAHSEFKTALEKFFDYEGKPYGQDGNTVFALYGEICHSVMVTKRQINHLLKEQEKS